MPLRGCQMNECVPSRRAGMSAVVVTADTAVALCDLADQGAEIINGVADGVQSHFACVTLDQQWPAVARSAELADDPRNLHVARAERGWAAVVAVEAPAADADGKFSVHDRFTASAPGSTNTLECLCETIALNLERWGEGLVRAAWFRGGEVVRTRRRCPARGSFGRGR